MTLRLTLLCLFLSACSDMPSVTWPPGAGGPMPDLLPMADLAAPAASQANARGTALAAEAEALKTRAAAIPDH